MMATRRVTINDIADHVGVSRSTVSLVLRGDKRISPATREKVQAAIRSLGYTYNRSAANLRSQTSQAIGLVVSDLTNPFFAEMTTAVERAVHADGYLVYLAQSGDDPVHQHELVASMLEYGVAGLIICPAINSRAETFDRLHAQGVPACLTVRAWPDDRFDFSGPNFFRAGQMATEALLERGHNRIAFLGGERGNPSHDDRLAGYFNALQKRDIVFDPALVIESRPSRVSGLVDVEKVLALPHPPTAALCYSDFVAMSVMHGLRRHGMEPGRDMALIGFDGMAESELTYPPLSTMALHPRKVGANAAELLLARIADRERPAERRVQAPTLILRESAGAPQAPPADVGRPD